MYINVVEIMGNVEVKDKDIGKAILFNIIDDEYTFNCIMYVGTKMDPFIVLHDEDEKYNDKEILKEILNKYNLQKLLEA